MTAIQYPVDLGNGVYMIDLVDPEPGRSSCYILKGEKNAIIEVGSSHAQPRIMEGIAKVGLQPADIDYVIVTHIHLDHSGGLGSIMPLLPNATAVCHPRAARHLIDPSRLIAGAAAVYGDELERIFGTILPVPEERLIIREDGEQIDLGSGHLLTFYDTPGHARHHFSIHDPAARGIFTGDTIGVRYVKSLTGWDFECIFPSTSPSEFDRHAVMVSCEKLEALNPERIFHTHFGPTEPASEAFARTRKTVDDYDQMARDAFAAGATDAELAEKIREYIRADLAKEGHLVQDLSGIELDIKLNAQGLLFVLEREQAKKNA